MSLGSRRKGYCIPLPYYIPLNSNLTVSEQHDGVKRLSPQRKQIQPQKIPGLYLRYLQMRHQDVGIQGKNELESKPQGKLKKDRQFLVFQIADVPATKAI